MSKPLSASIDHSNGDPHSLLAAVGVAAVFLGPTLELEYITPGAAEMALIDALDRGRMLDELARLFDDDQLRHDARRALEHGETFERIVESEDGQFLAMRVLPHDRHGDVARGVLITFADVTEREASERELRQAQNYAEAIVETLPDPLLVLSSSLTVESANTAFYEHFDVKPEQTEGRQIYELGNGQWDIPDLRRLLEDVLPRNKVFTGYEVVHEFESLGRRVMLLNGRQLDHQQLILLGIRDVTAQTAAAEELRESEARHRKLVAELEAERRRLGAVIDSLPVGFWMVNAEGRMVLVNDKAHEIWGGQAHVTETVEEMGAYKAWWADTGEPITAHDMPLARALRGEPCVNAAVEIERSDGTRGTQLVSAAPIRGADGSIIGAVAAVQDITERKRTEEQLRRSDERLRTVLETSLDAAYRRDLRTDSYDYLSRTEEVMGISAERMSRMGVQDLIERIHPDDRPGVVSAIERGMRELTGRVEYRFRDDAGNYRWLADHFSVQVDSEGRPTTRSGIVRNVTEQKQAEAALRESEARYRTLFEIIDEGFCILEMLFDEQGRPSDYRWLEINPAFERHTGLSGAVGKTAKELVPNLEQHWIDIYGRVALTGVSHRFVEQSEAMGRWFEVEAFPVGQPDQHRVGLLFMDVTARKQNEEQLRRNHDTFYNLIQNNPFGIYVIDADFRLRQISLGAQKVFETIDPPIGRDFGEILREIWQEPFASEAIAIFRHTLETGEPYASPKTVERRQDIGEIESYDWRAERIMLPDGRYGVVCYFYDLSERARWEEALRRSEVRYRAIVEGQSEMICRFRPDGTVIFVNGAYARNMGTTPEKLAGDNFWQFIPEEDRPHIREMLTQLSPESPQVRVENRLETVHGPRWTFWTNRALTFDQDGAATEIQSLGIDITERKLAEQALQQAQAELEERVAERTSELERHKRRLQALARELSATEQRERKRLAAILHDELQQYLVAVKMRLAMARQRSDSDEVATIIDECFELSDEAIASSRNLTQELRPPVLFEDGLVPALRWLTGEMTRRHGLKIHFDTTDGQMPLDEDERSMLYESVRELLLNVVKHAGVSEAGLKVSRDDHQLTLTVSDEGPGFDFATSDRRRHEQAGLGLFSIRERLEPIGGRVRIDSEPGQGASVSLLMPLQVTPEAPDDAGEQADQPQTPSEASVDRQQICVLVVDDHTIVRQGLVNLLDSDPRVEVVGEEGDGVAAIAAVEKLLPDLVLMDVNMPRMNGIEATRQIRKRWPQVQVIGLSVQDDAATRESMLEAGASAFMSKSEQSGRLVDTILSLPRRD